MTIQKGEFPLLSNTIILLQMTKLKSKIYFSWYRVISDDFQTAKRICRPKNTEFALHCKRLKLCRNLYIFIKHFQIFSVSFIYIHIHTYIYTYIHIYAHIYTHILYTYNGVQKFTASDILYSNLFLKKTND